MLAVFNNVQPFLKRKPKTEYRRADNVAFKFHYKVTFVVLLASGILVSTYNYFDSSGSAIQCYFDKNIQVPATVINRYCWMRSTFTLPKYFEGEPGEDFIHPGVGFHTEEDETIEHAYYQWVPLFLSFQAVFFYAPHWIWKQLDGGLFQNLTENVKSSPKEVSDYLWWRLDNKKNIGKASCSTLAPLQSWGPKFVFCEFLNLANLILQMCLTDVFLGGEFSQYGLKALNFVFMEPENRVDPMSRVFPWMTKCIFHKYGGSGTIQRFDALCVLGMNIINEKIFLLLWAWYIGLLVGTIVALGIRISQIFNRKSRSWFLKRQTLKELEYRKRCKYEKIIDAAVEQLNFSEWLMLYYMSQALPQDDFVVLLDFIGSKVLTNMEK